VVHLTGTGTCTVTASQPGNGNYAPAADVANAFAISQPGATITLSNLTQVYDGTAKSVTVTTSPSDLATVTTYDGGLTLPTHAGSYAVVVSLDDPAFAATPVTGTFVVQRAHQTIAFARPADRTYGARDFALSATSSWGLPVSFAATGPCLVQGTVVHLTGAGICRVTASQSGTADVAPATPVARSFTVHPAVTKTTDAVSPTSVKHGARVRITAHVTPASVAGAPVRGVVRFFIGGKGVGKVALRNGVATLKVRVTLPPGRYHVVARFVSARTAIRGSSGTTPLRVHR
jgi:hypothetical protein